MSIRVLIVDDAPFIREVLKSTLTQAGYSVVGEAQDGTEAVKMCDTLKPDLIVMDIIMPHQSGLQASQKILKKHPKVKIIACSTLDDEAMIHRAIEAGCAAYIQKPFEKNNLLKVIGQVSSIR